MRRVRGCVSVETAREIVEKLPESVEKVGVFVDVESARRLQEIVLEVGLTAVQLHDDGVDDDVSENVDGSSRENA